VDSQELCRRWSTTIPAIADYPLRVAFARHQLESSSAGALAVALDELCKGVNSHDALSREVYLAFLPNLVDPELLPSLQRVRLCARQAKLPALGRLLHGTTPAGHRLDEKTTPSNQKIAQSKDGSPLSLGERRALARRPSRQLLQKLLSDPHPMVARILLLNPQITESDVMIMASKRPMTTHIAIEVAKSWALNPRIRLTLVQNPGCPIAVGIPMLQALARPELLRVSQATNLEPPVRSIALELHTLRPPMKETNKPRTIH
jgi:hypothetical protein